MKGDLIDLPINKITELVISTYIGDLYEYLQKEMDTVIISLRGCFFFKFLFSFIVKFFFCLKQKIL